MAFDPKKEALMKMRGKKTPEPEVQNPMDSEMAPELGGENVPHGTIEGQPGEILEIPPEGGEGDLKMLLMQILEALSGKGEHPGREAQTLGERASDGARERMASMKKDVV